MNSNDTNQSQENKQKKIDWKKYFTKKHLIIYGAALAAIALIVVLVILLGGKSDDLPEETTPVETTPVATDPEETTTSAPIVTYPSDEESDPKQEDVFYD